MPDLFQDTFAPILPFEHPTWTVAVHLSGGVLVAQHVIAHHRKDACFCFCFFHMKIKSFPILFKEKQFDSWTNSKGAYKSAGFGRDGPAGSTVSLAVGAPWLKRNKKKKKMKSNRKRQSIINEKRKKSRPSTTHKRPMIERSPFRFQKMDTVSRHLDG